MHKYRHLNFVPSNVGLHERATQLIARLRGGVFRSPRKWLQGTTGCAPKEAGHFDWRGLFAAAFPVVVANDVTMSPS